MYAIRSYYETCPGPGPEGTGLYQPQSHGRGGRGPGRQYCGKRLASGCGKGPCRVITSYSIHYTKLYDHSGCPEETGHLAGTVSKILERKLQIPTAIVAVNQSRRAIPVCVPVKPVADPVEIIDLRPPEAFRITSYNVCYTKLLRKR